MSGAHIESHGPHDKGIALLISVLALVLAFSETLGKSAQTEALDANIQASNLWSFFQAKTIRQTTLRTAAEQLELLGTSPAAKQQIEAWKANAERYESQPDKNEGRKELAARANKAERRRDRAMTAYHHYELASAAVQIGIVLASASIITAMPVLAWIAGALGAIGTALCVVGFWFPALLHLA
ncbi:MAG: DUF4337 domain-containing protein [Burkholderiales bacterium]